MQIKSLKNLIKTKLTSKGNLRGYIPNMSKKATLNTALFSSSASFSAFC